MIKKAEKHPIIPLSKLDIVFRHSLGCYNILSIFIVTDENYKFFGSEESFKSIDHQLTLAL